MATSTQGLDSLVARLRDVVEVWAPVSDADVHHAERLFGRELPGDLLEFYRRLNGTRDETPPENGWVQFLPMHKWQTVQDVLSPTSGDVERKYRPIFGAIVFAEYCQSSWWYAFGSPTSEANEATIYFVDGWRDPFAVASRFNDFMATVLVDGREMYPRD